MRGDERPASFALPLPCLRGVEPAGDALHVAGPPAVLTHRPLDVHMQSGFADRGQLRRAVAAREQAAHGVGYSQQRRVRRKGEEHRMAGAFGQGLHRVGNGLGVVVDE